RPSRGAGPPRSREPPRRLLEELMQAAEVAVRLDALRELALEGLAESRLGDRLEEGRGEELAHLRAEERVGRIARVGEALDRLGRFERSLAGDARGAQLAREGLGRGARRGGQLHAVVDVEGARADERRPRLAAP